MIDIQQLYRSNKEFRDSRLNSLFSDFSGLKESNPEGYMANLNAWKHFLSSVFNHGEMLSFNYTFLKKMLLYRTSRRDYLPEGLYIVLNDMINNDKSLILESTLNMHNESQRPGILLMLKNAFFGTNIIDVRNKQTCVETLLSVEVLENKCKVIKEKLFPILDSDALNLDHLRSILTESNIDINKHDLLLCLQYLQRDFDKLEISNDIVVMKNGDARREDESGEVVYEDLKHISDLSYTIYKLQKYSNEKIQEVSDIDKKLKKSLHEKNLIVAKTQLKLKKLHEIQINKTLNSLENLHTLKIKVEDAQNNLLISKVWKENTNVMKLLNQKAEVSDETFDELYREIQQTDHISNKLGTKFADPEDEAIDKELAELESQVISDNKRGEEQEIEEIQKKLDSLKLPTSKPLGEKGTQTANQKQQEVNEGGKKEDIETNKEAVLN